MSKREPRTPWIPPFIEVMAEFAELAPSMAPDPSSYPAMKIAAERLKELVGTLRETKFSKGLSSDDLELVNSGIERLRALNRDLRVSFLRGVPMEFRGFDEMQFFEQLRSASRERVVNLYRQAIRDPLQLTGFEAVTQMGTFQEYGLPISALAGPGIIIFKIIVVILLIILVFLLPEAQVIAFAIAAVKALAEFDKAAKGKAGAQKYTDAGYIDAHGDVHSDWHDDEVSGGHHSDGHGDIHSDYHFDDHGDLGHGDTYSDHGDTRHLDAYSDHGDGGGHGDKYIDRRDVRHFDAYSDHGDGDGHADKYIDRKSKPGKK